jgi:putative MFS transporter
MSTNVRSLAVDDKIHWSPQATEEKISNNYFDGLPVTGIHKFVFYIIMLAYFFEQLDNWNFGFIAPALQQSWGLQMTDIATIVFWYFIGMTSGGFLGGVISDFIGRRKTFLASILIFSLASVATGFTDNFVVFTVFRALTGFGVFCLMVTSQAYIAEMAPAETRGKWQGRVAGVGFCAVPVIALLCRLIIPMGPEAWRVILYIGGLGVIGFFLGLKYLKESPRWLVAQKRLTEAEEVMEFITKMKIDLKEASTKVPPRERVSEVLVGMFTKHYIVRTLLLILLFISITPATFTLTTWTTQLLKMKGFSVADSLTASTFISIGVPAGCFLASFVSDLGGRKTPLLILGALCTISAFFFAQLDGFELIIACGFIFNVLIMALSFVLFSYTAESYPTKMRNTATGFHNGLARLSVSAVQPIIPIIHKAAGFTGVFSAVGMLFFVPLIPLLLWGLRTGGKSLEDIK